MQKISVYYNGKASKTSSVWKDKIMKTLFRSELNFKSFNSLYELHQELELDIKNKTEGIIAIGGDGTVNTIIQKLAGSDVALLVVPAGTANDLANNLGIDKNIKLAAHIIRENHLKKLDLISINKKLMVSNGGLGLASEVAKEINELREKFPQFKKMMKITGKGIYSIFLAKKLIMKKISFLKYKINSAEFSSTIKTPLILINNQSIIGGTFNIAPNTVNNDGTFNVTIFTHSNAIELIKAIGLVFMGKYPINDKKLISFETKKVDIKLIDGFKDIVFFGDGEILSTDRSWSIEIQPLSLNVFTNKDDQHNNFIVDDVSVV